jgi:hypothetical protein
MTTTAPLTTCPPIPDYLTLRKQNLAQIEKYYDELLYAYVGLAGNNMESAQNMLATYHNQLNAAAESLLNNLNTTIDLVSEQYSTIQENSDLVKQNRTRITQLKKDIKRLMAETEARQKNAVDTKESTIYTSYWHKGFLAISIILLLVCLGLLIWIFLKPSSDNTTATYNSNYGKNTSTNNTKNNNTAKTTTNNARNKIAANLSKNLI